MKKLSFVIKCFVLLALIFGGCEFFFDKIGFHHEPETDIPEGYGIVRFNFVQGEARTIIPVPALDALDLVFTFYSYDDDIKGNLDDQPDTEEDNGQYKFVLKEGSYLLEVKAFVEDSTDDEDLVAEGEAEFNVVAGTAVPINVKLHPIATSDDGVGTLNFSGITFPDEVTVEFFTFDFLLVDDPAPFTELLNNRTEEHVLEDMPVGYYLLQLGLRHENGAFVTKTEVVHIYQNLTTLVEYEFTDADFPDDFSIYFVTKEEDNENLPGSLRHALSLNDVQTIRIMLEPGSVILLEETLQISGDRTLVIEGNGVTLEPYYYIDAWDEWVTDTVNLLRITATGSNVTIRRVQFKNGVGKSGSDGGAIQNEGNLTIESCIFNANTGEDAGAILNTGTLTVKGSTFYFNNTRYHGPGGGAINSVGANTTIIGNVFYKNTANGVLSLPCYGTITSLGYNVVDLPFGTINNYSGWAQVTGDSYDPVLSFSNKTFKPFDRSKIETITSTRPANYPTRDFYGNRITFPAVAGAVQQEEIDDRVDVIVPDITHPFDAEYKEGDTSVALSVVLDPIKPGYEYQWFSNENNDSTGGDLIWGADGSTYTPDLDEILELYNGTAYYYVVITYTDVDEAINGTRSFRLVSETAKVTVLSYGISLSQSSLYTFPAEAFGYGALTPHTVTITNTGNQSTGTLGIELSGANASSFTLSPATISDLADTDDEATFTVVPNTGLAGAHTATVTVTGGNGISASFDVSFTVSLLPGMVDITGKTVADIKTDIDAALGVYDEVTIVGSVNDAESTLTMDIAAGKKVIWQANYSGANTTDAGSGLLAVNGSGDFEIRGGSIAATNGTYAINTNGSGNFIVSGGTVTSTGTSPLGYAINIFGSDNDGRTVTISDGEVTSNWFAINIDNNTSNVTVDIMGGTITGIQTIQVGTGSGHKIIVSDGQIINPHTDINRMDAFVFNSPGLLFINGGTVTSPRSNFDLSGALAIERTETTTTYTLGSNTDLTVDGSGATAVWAIVGDKHGISYERDINTGFIEVPGVTVVAATPTVFVTGGDTQSFTDIATAVAWINANPGTYTADITANQNVGPMVLNVSDVKLTLTASSAMNINLNAQGALFTVGAAGETDIELTLASNVTLVGLANGQNGATQDNNAPVVIVQNGASFIMNTDSKITGNKRISTYGSASGVQLDNGNFTMNGGEITGNSFEHEWGGENQTGVGLHGGASQLNLAGGSITGNAGGNIKTGLSDIFIYAGTSYNFVLSGDMILGHLLLSGSTTISIDDWTENVNLSLHRGEGNIDNVISGWTDTQVIQGASGYTLQPADINRFTLGNFMAHGDDSRPISDTHELDVTGKLIVK